MKLEEVVKGVQKVVVYLNSTVILSQVIEFVHQCTVFEEWMFGKNLLRLAFFYAVFWCFC